MFKKSIKYLKLSYAIWWLEIQIDYWATKRDKAIYVDSASKRVEYTDKVYEKTTELFKLRRSRTKIWK